MVVLGLMWRERGEEEEELTVMRIVAITVRVDVAVAVAGVTKQEQALLTLEERREHWE